MSDSWRDTNRPSQSLTSCACATAAASCAAFISAICCLRTRPFFPSAFSRVLLLVVPLTAVSTPIIAVGTCTAENPIEIRKHVLAACESPCDRWRMLASRDMRWRTRMERWISDNRQSSPFDTLQYMYSFAAGDVRSFEAKTTMCCRKRRMCPG